MAATALDILSLDDARAQLDIEPDDTAQDAEITAAIEAAVLHAENITGAPLIDKNQTIQVVPMGNELPIILYYRDIKQVNSINFWQPDQKHRETPTGVVDVNSLGYRVEKVSGVEGGWVTEQWPPEAGWPDRAGEAPELVVSVKLGVDAANIPDFRQAIILLMRQFFEQPDRMESDFAVQSLLSAQRRWNG